MGTLAIGISVMLLVYAFFLYITFRYFFGNENSKHSYLNDYKKKIKEFVESLGNLGKLQKQ
ncbi:hypothetical protein GTQ34_15920 [Muricauda sp. JGD-17]|uniref:Uncharacterized protein n=1 Tax=Flagellimonas ochracea TaxID=2696472 RepID=A0A964WYZ5_9FLAO|nr:hypothetical protein [Allomuricauda ochracea]NAY93398.1 hypothetical protein [Allomuricauda ochracea]